MKLGQPSRSSTPHSELPCNVSVEDKQRRSMPHINRRLRPSSGSTGVKRPHSPKPELGKCRLRPQASGSAYVVARIVEGALFALCRGVRLIASGTTSNEKNRSKVSVENWFRRRFGRVGPRGGCANHGRPYRNGYQPVAGRGDAQIRRESVINPWI